MYDAGDCHYYIDELARLKSGNLTIPVRWVEDSKRNVFADAYQLPLITKYEIFPYVTVLIQDIDITQFVANIDDNEPTS